MAKLLSTTAIVVALALGSIPANALEVGDIFQLTDYARPLPQTCETLQELRSGNMQKCGTLASGSSYQVAQKSDDAVCVKSPPPHNSACYWTVIAPSVIASVRPATITVESEGLNNRQVAAAAGAAAKALDHARSVYSKFELAPGPGWNGSEDRKYPGYNPETGYSVWEKSLNCEWYYSSYTDFAPKSKGCTERGNMLTLSYHDGATISAKASRDALLQRVKEVVPLLMKNFPEIDSVSIDVYSDFVDIKGNEKVDKMFGVRIDRRTADSTNWPNIKTDNIMKFAEVFYQHRAVTKELGNANAEKDQESIDRCIRSGFCSRY
jgi:hypothetical protein